ncbi:MAG TPA: deoxyguanosinetriphosphate triphosphohydrolase, partial [Opitutales bacterium]|nr:deoxyguanosinetriphosphate triphosphohydrolase [Opitutales bacterium]
LHLIFKSTQLQQIEFKGGHILERLFQGLSEHCAEDQGGGLRILSSQVLELMDQESTTGGRYRRLCDYIAGLTDGLAVRTYKRLYDADFGSIAELV